MKKRRKRGGEGCLKMREEGLKEGVVLKQEEGRFCKSAQSRSLEERSWQTYIVQLIWTPCGEDYAPELIHQPFPNFFPNNVSKQLEAFLRLFLLGPTIDEDALLQPSDSAIDLSQFLGHLEHDAALPPQFAQEPAEQVGEWRDVVLKERLGVQKR
jgi:hypothetical protein